MTREPIYAALFTKLAASAGYVTTGRRLKHWNDVTVANQPALFMAQKRETAQPAQPVPGLPTKWVLEVDVYVYAKAIGSASPGPIINPLLDAIVTALAPVSATGKQTLGGLCEHAWIEGAIETDEGTLGDQAVAIVPVRVLVAT